MTSPKYGYTDLENNAGNVSQQNRINRIHEALANMRVESDTLTTPPAHTEGNVYLVATGATGAWSGQDGNLALSIGAAWTFIAPAEGMAGWFANVEQWRLYDGAVWIEQPVSVTTGITASTTQTQGQQPLTSFVNGVTTVANANDVVTLKAAQKGARQVVHNRGANTLQVFPASGDAIDALGTNNSTTIAAGASLMFDAVSAALWFTR